MRKTVWSVVIALAVLVGVPTNTFAQCAKIQGGTITALNGIPITTGFDQYGYNYQAHMFNGLATNFTRPPVPDTEGTENLVMKWSDDWIANVDCNGDGKLDRGLNAKTGVVTGISTGWVTNHYEGDYLGTDGEMHHYTYFAKIAYVGPAQVNDPWASVRIWGLYAIIEEIQNDPFGEYGGRLKSDKLVAPGLGRF